MTDSNPNFLARCSALGLSEQIQDELVVAGLDTISKFALSSSYVPGQQDEQPFRDAMQAALTNPPSVGEAATLRHLLHESYAMTAAELKQTVDRSEDQGVKRLAQPERADRLRRQQDKLQGLAIRGNLEPSDRLVDVAVTMFEENRLGYIEPSACTSKSQEVLSKSKEDKHISIVDGSLRIKNPANKLEAELGTDLLLRYALTRRGLALDQANILEFSLHDAWVEKLMEVKHTSSPQGYAAVQYNQLLNADRRLFTKLAELTRAGIQVDGAGRPLDAVFPNATEHPEVQLLLQPLPAPPVATDRDSPYRRQPSGKGKTKGTGYNSLPAQLRDFGVSATPQGHALCFGYSLKNCKLQVTRNRCAKGLHLCCYKGCFKNHPYVDCPKLKESKAE